MKLSEELKWRGFVSQTTLKDLTELDKKTFTFYWGVDPSADSMTVGNFAAAMMVRRFIDHGHKAVLLVGGATGLIGDPDGKAEERQLKTLEQIAKNKAGIAAQYKQVFAGKDFQIVDNYDWFKGVHYLDFLRDIGKHFSMTQLLQRDFIQSRIGEGGKGISYAEFSYSLIQGYDFYHLFKTQGVTMQLCGVDQWGNSISGLELIRKLEGAEAQVYSCPLVINKSTGKKFGKSEEGAVWLDPNKTSVFAFYQFWLNVDDAGVEDYLKIFTLLSKPEVDELMREFKADPAGRAAQKRLAYEVTSIVHGKDRADGAKLATEVLFGRKKVTELSDSQLTTLGKEIPKVASGRKDLVEILVQSGLVSSASEGRRMIAAGGITVNGEKRQENGPLTTLPALVKKGKNSFALVVK